MGVLQGVTELFPVSSLGHSVLFPTLLGWTNLVQAQSDPESFFLAFLVGLHLATALALVAFYWRDWLRIAAGFFTSLRYRRIQTADEKLAWLLILATLPTGAIALLLEHTVRTFFAKPLYAAVFLMVNGLILWGTERVVARRAGTGVPLESMKFTQAGAIGVFQTASLLAGISRAGISFVGGLLSGLTHQAAARFSFLLATPIILLAGVYKLPDLLGPNGDGVRGPILAGSLAAGVAAYLSVRFLDRYFAKRRTTPYAWYCIAFGAAMAVKLIWFP
jgi:undecaprenyl-diphosphatase